MNLYFNSGHERVWIYFITGAIITLAVGIVVGRKHYFLTYHEDLEKQGDLRDCFVLITVTKLLNVAQ